MTFVVCCDGAGKSGANGDSKMSRIEVISDRAAARQNLRIEPLESAVNAPVPEIAADLVRIAAYVYFADQMASRGGDREPSGDHWQRRFLVHAPLGQPDVWSRPEVKKRLAAAIGFGTQDDWDFEFEAGPAMPVQAWMPGLPLPTGADSADCVAAFSGGLDSLVAALDLVADGRRPLLVSHESSTVLSNRRGDLIEALRSHEQRWSFPPVAIHINKVGVPEKERTQRSRSMLYASLGAAMAAAIGVPDVVLADNGYVSVGIPINSSVIGAMASPTTHPKFIWLFNHLLREVFPGIHVRNPLLTMTRADVLARLETHGGVRLIGHTTSCSAARALPRESHQCGFCSQCLDRRMAVLTLGLEQFDGHYAYDVFTAELKDEPCAIAESYVRLARRLAQLDAEQVFEQFVELTDCAVGLSQTELRAVAEMLIRHGVQTVAALKRAAEQNLDLLTSGRLPPTCLLRIGIASDATLTRNAFGKDSELPILPTPADEEEIEMAGLKARVTLEFTGQSLANDDGEVVVDGQSAFLPRGEFLLLFRLAYATWAEGEAWVHFEGSADRPGLRELVGDIDFYKAASRLRKALQPFLGAVRGKDFVQVNSKRSRLPVHRAYVKFCLPELRRHGDARVQDLARRLEAMVDARGQRQRSE